MPVIRHQLGFGLYKAVLVCFCLRFFHWFWVPAWPIAALFAGNVFAQARELCCTSFWNIFSSNIICIHSEEEGKLFALFAKTAHFTPQRCRKG